MPASERQVKATLWVAEALAASGVPEDDAIEHAAVRVFFSPTFADLEESERRALAASAQASVRALVREAGSIAAAVEAWRETLR